MTCQTREDRGSGPRVRWPRSPTVANRGMPVRQRVESWPLVKRRGGGPTSSATSRHRGRAVHARPTRAMRWVDGMRVRTQMYCDSSRSGQVKSRAPMREIRQSDRGGSTPSQTTLCADCVETRPSLFTQSRTVGSSYFVPAPSPQTSLQESPYTDAGTDVVRDRPDCGAEEERVRALRAHPASGDCLFEWLRRSTAAIGTQPAAESHRSSRGYLSR